MFFQKATLILYVFSCLTICNNIENVSGKMKSTSFANKFKESTAWYAMKVFSDMIVFAGQTGEFFIMNPETGQKFELHTDLDLSLITATDSGFAAIGRWNTKLIRWNIKSKKEDIVSQQLFTGRSNALYYYNSIIYISGADKDASNLESKDNVRLLPGMIFSLDTSGQLKKLDITAEGRITYLAVGDSWIAWVDDKFKNRLFIKSEKKGMHFFDFNADITSVVADHKSVYVVGGKCIYAVNPLSVSKEMLHEFKKIDLEILKLIKFNDQFYGLTSEGVFKFPEEKKVNRKTGQPVDIEIYKNEIIVLWQDGDLEYIKKDGTVIQDVIH